MVTTDKDQEFESPDPKKVGNEFVRQYYKLLHEGPEYLHLFYSDNSTFVHGEVEKPGKEDKVSYGQREIKEKIESLKFHNTHSNIFKVDCQEAYGGGVVVQTVGEIFMEGIMRRFLQTFMLAPKGPRKYYVRNDILRYQDGTFDDESDPTEGENAQEVTENDSFEDTPTETPMETPTETPMETPTETPMETPTEMPMEITVAPEASETVPPISEPVAEETDVTPAVVEPISVAERDEEEKPPSSPNEEKPADEDMQPASPTETQPESSPEATEKESPKTFSWAAMVSRHTPTSNDVSVSPSVGAEPRVVRKPPEKKPERTPAATSAPSRGNSKPAETPRGSRPQREPVLKDSSNRTRGENGSMDSSDGRRNFAVGSRYPDNQQLFVGNLPHYMSENQLKRFFEQYGNVLELRINTKGSGGRLPNFGFVVFDSKETAQEILRQKPIMYNGEHRLNVEEKKTRGSEGRPTRGGRYGGGTRNFGPRGGPRNGGDRRPYEQGSHRH